MTDIILGSRDPVMLSQLKLHAECTRVRFVSVLGTNGEE